MVSSQSRGLAAKTAASLCRTPRLPFSPNSPPKLGWDIVGLVLICWDVFFIPLTALELPQVTFTTVMDWITLIFWTCDIFVSFAPLGRSNTVPSTSKTWESWEVRGGQKYPKNTDSAMSDVVATRE
eukprot:Skav204182  [mRNA]  locus=scaffold903:683335:687266:- [translate_table: standard]